MFSREIKKRFQNPKNAGDLINYNAQGQAKGEDCSDFITIKINIAKGIVKNAKFQVQGCPGAICTADAYIDLVKGLSIEDALKIGEKEVAAALGIFPEEYLHCARLPIAAFKKAVKNSCPKIIGITGGKGGTGKSTVAAALAYALAKKHKVLLVDADVDCPNDHLLLGIKRRFLKKTEQRIPEWEPEKCGSCGLCGTVCKTNAIVSIRGKNPIFMPSQCNGCGACVLKCPKQAIGWSRKDIGKIYSGSKYGIDLLSGELNINEPISEIVVNSLDKLVSRKKADYDYIIIDTAAGTHCPVLAALKICDIALAVTEPTPLGGHDLDLILKLAKKLRLETKIIINRSDTGDKEIIDSLAKKHKKAVISEIPYSKGIVLKQAAGMPIVNKNISKIIKILK